MRKKLLLCSVICLLVLFTSCFPKSELKETAIVQAIGIDVGEKADFLVTLQIYAPQSTGAGASLNTAENNATIISGEGDSVSQAIHQAAITAGKEVFTGYNRLLIIGRELAEQGVLPIFSYFDRNTNTRQNVEVLMADGSAKEIVSIDIKQGILAAEMIEKMLEQRNLSGYISYMPYYELTKDMYLYNGSAIMPVISKIEKESSDQEKQQESEKGSEKSEEKDSQGSSEQQTIPMVQQVDVTKSAIFENYQLKAELNEAGTRGSVLLHNQLEETVVITYDEDDNQATIRLYKCNVTLTPTIEDDVVTIHARVEAEGTLDEVLNHNIINTEERFQAWQSGCEETLEKEMQQSFEIIFNQCHANVLNITERIDLIDNQWIEKQGDDWIQNLQFDVAVHVNIARVGMQTNEK